jgi:hypothetical protein
MVLGVTASRLAPRWTLTTAGAISATPTARRGLYHAAADRVHPARH